MKTTANILVVDDEPNIRLGLAKGLKELAERIDTAADAIEGIRLLDENKYHLIIADVRLPGDLSGLELVSEAIKRHPGIAAIVITAHGTVETAVEAMRRGAFDFITKPVDLNLIRQQVRKALEHTLLQAENRELKSRLAAAGEIAGIIGKCAAMQDIFQQVRQVAQTDATVLIQGESGTGKELIAQALHDLSDRKEGPFVAVNLGALPETLLESELFGHEKGSFTGAARQKPGCFERATGGTLFLDEVTEMPVKSQVDLLRVLESGQYTRVGGEAVLTADARLISATNKDILELIENGSFREDLYYRLHIVPIHLPSLRERREDIPMLAEHYLKHFCDRHHRENKQFSSEAMQQLSIAPWPGNVRQLRNLVERVVVTISDTVIEADQLPKDLSPRSERGNLVPQSLAEAAEAAEKQAIQNALLVSDCHRETTARTLGISVRTLHYKMNRYGLH
jgi:two-component system response regulator AtoC